MYKFLWDRAGISNDFPLSSYRPVTRKDPNGFYLSQLDAINSNKTLVIGAGLRFARAFAGYFLHSTTMTDKDWETSNEKER